MKVNPNIANPIRRRNVGEAYDLLLDNWSQVYYGSLELFIRQHPRFARAQQFDYEFDTV